MSERRIDLTESQLRKLVKSVWDEAFSDGETCAVHRASDAGFVPQDCDESWQASLSHSVVDDLIALEQEHSE